MNSILNELKITVISELRYPFEFIVELIMITIMYWAILIGAKLIGGSELNLGNFEGKAAIGFVVWMICSEIVNQFPNKIVHYARIGILEQIFISPLGGETIIVLDQIMSILWHMVKAGIVFTILVLLTQTHLFFNTLIIPVSVLIIMGVMGIGFILIGMGVRFNKITAFTAVVSYLFLGLALTPTKGMYAPWVANSLPFVLGINALKEILLNRTSMGSWEFLILVVNSCFYFFFGLFIMHLCVSKAKKGGLLGQY